MLLQIRFYPTYLPLQQVTPAPSIMPVMIVSHRVQNTCLPKCCTDDDQSNSTFEHGSKSLVTQLPNDVVLLGQPARLALLQRLLPILGSMRGLQRATVQASSVACMQKVAALSRAQLVRLAKVPSARSGISLTDSLA